MNRGRAARADRAGPIPTASVPTGQAALDNLLKEDRLKRDKELEKIKWFHANTPRNLAEKRLKEGKYWTRTAQARQHILL